MRKSFNSAEKWKIQKELARKKSEEKFIKKYNSLEAKRDKDRERRKNYIPRMDTPIIIPESILADHAAILAYDLDIARIKKEIKGNEQITNSIVRFVLSDESNGPKHYSAGFKQFLDSQSGDDDI